MGSLDNPNDSGSENITYCIADPLSFHSAGTSAQPYALGYGTPQLVSVSSQLESLTHVLGTGSYGGFGRYPRAVVPPGAPQPPARSVGAVTFGHPLQPRLQMSTAPIIGWPGDPSRVSS